MDAFLCGEARGEIRALGLLRADRRPKGLLLGHRRARRIYVERIFPWTEDFASLPRRLPELENTLGESAVGVFAFGLTGKDRKAVLGPDFFGKLVLDIPAGLKKAGVARAFTVEFNGAFFLSPVPVAGDTLGGRHV